jgi:oligopeptide transport system permease protein
MTGYIARRMLWLIPVVLIVAGLTFILMHNAPGGPWDRDPNSRQVDPVAQARLNAFYGLDKPLVYQFTSYLIGGRNLVTKQWSCGLICGNMGPSYRVRGMTVQQYLFTPPVGKSFLYSKAGYSLRLGVLSLLLAVVVGIPVGVISALKQNTWIDYVSLFIATVGISVPNFVIAIFLIIIFASTLKMVPVIPISWDDVSVWVLPAVVLGFGTLARSARLTRASMLEVMRMDYIRTARAKGLTERLVIYRHMIKNAMIPVVTFLGPALAGLVTGSFIIETIFGFPGMGRAYVTAISNRDYSMIMGTTIIFAVIVAVMNLVVDVVYVFLDPRIKLAD